MPYLELKASIMKGLVVKTIRTELDFLVAYPSINSTCDTGHRPFSGVINVPKSFLRYPFMINVAMTSPRILLFRSLLAYPSQVTKIISTSLFNIYFPLNEKYEFNNNSPPSQ